MLLDAGGVTLPCVLRCFAGLWVLTAITDPAKTSSYDLELPVVCSLLCSKSGGPFTRSCSLLSQATCHSWEPPHLRAAPFSSQQRGDLLSSPP